MDLSKSLYRIAESAFGMLRNDECGLQRKKRGLCRGICCTGWKGSITLTNNWAEPVSPTSIILMMMFTKSMRLTSGLMS